METNRRNFIGGAFALTAGMCLPSIAAPKHEDDIIDIRNIVVKEIQRSIFHVHEGTSKYLKAKAGRFSLLDCFYLDVELERKTKFLVGSRIHKICFATTIPKTHVIGVVFGIKMRPDSEMQYFRFAHPANWDVVDFAREWARRTDPEVEGIVGESFSKWVAEVQSAELETDMNEEDKISHIKNMYVPTSNYLFTCEGVHKHLLVVPSKTERGAFDVKLMWSYADMTVDADYKIIATTIKLKEIS